MKEIIHKEKIKTGYFYFTAEIPVTYKVNAEYERYIDDFGNSYYEDSYSYDILNEVKNQNPKLQEALDYIQKLGFNLTEEGVE